MAFWKGSRRRVLVFPRAWRAPSFQEQDAMTRRSKRQDGRLVNRTYSGRGRLRQDSKCMDSGVESLRWYGTKLAG